MSKNDYRDGSGDQIFIPCINWIPGLVVDQIKNIKASMSDEDRRDRDWRVILVIMYPNWGDYQEGFEGLGSLFGSEKQ